MAGQKVWTFFSLDVFLNTSGYTLELVASRLATKHTNSHVNFYIASHKLVTVLKI